jgi:hypothetical protein
MVPTQRKEPTHFPGHGPIFGSIKLGGCLGPTFNRYPFRKIGCPFGGALLHFHKISSYSGIFFTATRSFAPHDVHALWTFRSITRHDVSSALARRDSTSTLVRTVDEEHRDEEHRDEEHRDEEHRDEEHRDEEQQYEHDSANNTYRVSSTSVRVYEQYSDRVL